MTIKQLIARSLELYPTSQKMRRAWVRQTDYLYRNKKHAFQTGGWKSGTY